MSGRTTACLSACLMLLPLTLGQSCLPGLPERFSCANGDYFHYYGKQKLLLTLDVSRIGLYAPTGIDAPAADALAAAGIDVAQLAPHGIPGWYYAPVPAERADACGVEDIVATLAAGAAFSFVTPVFLDGPILITPDIMVGFKEDVSAGRAEAILNQANAGEITARDWSGLPGVYRLHSNSRSGFEVLTTTNDLAQRPEVLYAESDVIFTGRTN